MRLRALGLSQSQFRDRQNVQGFDIVRQQRQYILGTLLGLLHYLLAAAGGHQFRQLQLRAGVLGIQFGGFPEISGGCVEVV